MPTLLEEINEVSKYIELVQENAEALKSLTNYACTIYSSLNDNDKVLVYLSINPNEKLLSKIFLANYIRVNLSHLNFVKEWQVQDNTIKWFERN